MLSSFNTDHGRTFATRESTLGHRDPQEGTREPRLAELCFIEANGDPLLALDIACADLLRSEPR